MDDGKVHASFFVQYIQFLGTSDIFCDLGLISLYKAGRILICYVVGWE